MANEEKKDFNAMLHRETDMPKIQIVTDEATIKKYGERQPDTAVFSVLLSFSLHPNPAKLHVSCRRRAAIYP